MRLSIYLHLSAFIAIIYISIWILCHYYAGKRIKMSWNPSLVSSFLISPIWAWDSLRLTQFMAENKSWIEMILKRRSLDCNIQEISLTYRRKHYFGTVATVCGHSTSVIAVHGQTLWLFSDSLIISPTDHSIMWFVAWNWFQRHKFGPDDSGESKSDFSNRNVVERRA